MRYSGRDEIIKVKELLPLLTENQETSIYFKDFGHMSSYPKGFMYDSKKLEANILRIETVYLHNCNCTEVRIYTDFTNESVVIV